LATYPPDPLPLAREGGAQVREGRSPSLKSLPPLLKRREILKESQREAEPLLYNQSPFSLLRGRGIKGDGVTKKKLKGVRSINNLYSQPSINSGGDFLGYLN